MVSRAGSRVIFRVALIVLAELTDTQLSISYTYEPKIDANFTARMTQFGNCREDGLEPLGYLSDAKAFLA